MQKMEEPIRDKLAEMQRRYIKELRGLRKLVVKDIFERLAYIGPEDLHVINYKRSKPSAVFNPGAILHNGVFEIFPRLIFDYWKYTSSIGYFKIEVEEILDRSFETPIDTRIILWPQYLWEFLGTEDPRVHLFEDKLYILYTGKGYYYDSNREMIQRDVLGIATTDRNFSNIEKNFFKIALENNFFIPKSNKDSTLLELNNWESVILTRPEINKVRICWRGRTDLLNYTIDANSLLPVIVPEEWETKVGWSTNAVKISSNEYIVGWHGVLVNDLSYRNGLAIVDKEGELLAISDYILAPRGLDEEYGDRALVIFGDGLVMYKDILIWVGGISDYAIGIFSAEWDNVQENLRWVRG